MINQHMNDCDLRSHRERGDNYIWLVVQLSPNWRVIQCKDHLQWIIQRRDGQRSGRARWTGRHYCLTREALLRDGRTSCVDADPIAWAVLEQLPERYEARNE